MPKNKRTTNQQQQPAVSIHGYQELPRVTEDMPTVIPASYKETLDAIRNQAQDTRRETSRIIAELDAWRAEIDATIAMLKGRM